MHVALSLPARRLRSDLRLSCGEAVAFGGMVGLGETFLPAFVLAAGLGELTAGLSASLPLVAGGLLQLVSPAAVRWLGSHKRWVVLCASVQAATFLPLAMAAWSGAISRWAVFAVAAVYWAAGLSTGPAWNTWIGTTVPPRLRASFFALRTRGQQVAVFLGFVIGGLTLQALGKGERALPAFAALFAAAGLCRLISTCMLSCQSEPIPIPPNMRRIPFRELLTQLSEHDGGRLLVYLVAVQASVQMAGPYFTPFMFEKLDFSYVQFVSMIALAFLSKIVALPLWARVGQRIGAARLLWIGGVGIVPIGAGWLVSQSLPWLMVLQIFGGGVWAAYELAFFLLFFESIAPEERTSLLTLYNLLNTLAWLCGAVIGGALLWTWGATYQGYLVVFAASSLGRMTCLLLLRRLTMPAVATGQVGVRTVAVRPSSASLDAPVLPSLPDQLAASVVDAD